MFETATRKKFRYPFRGQISTEDLWDLNLPELDSVYKALTKEAKAKDDGESLLTENKADPDLLLRIKIVKAIFEWKQNDMKEYEDGIKRQKQKEKLLEALARKQDNALEQMSEAELKQAIEELG